MKKAKESKSKKSNFLEWNNNILISSLKKIDLNIVLIVILDALFYILSGYLAIFWLQRIQAKMSAFNIPQDILALGPERAQQLVSEVKTFYYLIIFSFILLLIAIIFLASILKGIIWAKTTNTKISFALISRFLGLNLIWMGFWFFLVFLFSILIEPNVVTSIKVSENPDLYFVLTTTHLYIIITILISLLLTYTLYTIFMEKLAFKSIINAVKLSIVKIHLFLLPYIVILLSLYVLIKITNLFRFKYSTILLGLIILIYTAIVRYYVSTLVLEIEKL